MEIITFDSEAFKSLEKKIDNIAAFIASSKTDGDNDKREVWLDSFELADLLKISLKTLQRLRKDKLISYSKLRGKCVYRLSDVEKGLSERLIKGEPKTLEEFRKNYMLKIGH